MSNNYCGPYALSHVLNVPVKTAARIIRKKTGQRAVYGVAPTVMRDVLKDSGQLIRQVRWDKPARIYPTGYCANGSEFFFGKPAGQDTRPRLIDWYRENKYDGLLAIVGVPGHYMVIDGDRIYDNHGTAKVENHLHNGRRLNELWELKRAAS